VQKSARLPDATLVTAIEVHPAIRADHVARLHAHHFKPTAETVNDLLLCFQQQCCGMVAFNRFTTKD